MNPETAEWPWSTTLEGEVDGVMVLKAYRWRFSANLDGYGRPRIFAQHRRLPTGGWCEVRNPDRLAQLRAMTPVSAEAA